MFPSTRFATQMAQMAMQAPFVMAARMGDWTAWTGSARQQREAGRMVAEKQAAAFEAASAFALHAWSAWAQLVFAPLQPWSPTRWERASQAMLAPYARRVRANATRLRKRRR